MIAVSLTDQIVAVDASEGVEVDGDRPQHITEARSNILIYPSLFFQQDNTPQSPLYSRTTLFILPRHSRPEAVLYGCECESFEKSFEKGSGPGADCGLAQASAM